LLRQDDSTDIFTLPFTKLQIKARKQVACQ
jgi:hypothetical protein